MELGRALMLGIGRPRPLPRTPLFPRWDSAAFSPRWTRTSCPSCAVLCVYANTLPADPLVSLSLSGPHASTGRLCSLLERGERERKVERERIEIERGTEKKERGEPGCWEGEERKRRGRKEEDQRKKGIWFAAHLAAEGAEAERVREAPAADLAGVGDALAGPGLRPAVEEHDLGAVDHVRLHVRDVDQLPHLRHPDHVVVRRPPYLHGGDTSVSGGRAGRPAGSEQEEEETRKGGGGSN
jgi:hypothetical protein